MSLFGFSSLLTPTLRSEALLIANREKGRGLVLMETPSHIYAPFLMASVINRRITNSAKRFSTLSTNPLGTCPHKPQPSLDIPLTNVFSICLSALTCLTCLGIMLIPSTPLPSHECVSPPVHLRISWRPSTSVLFFHHHSPLDWQQASCHSAANCAYHLAFSNNLFLPLAPSVPCWLNPGVTQKVSWASTDSCSFLVN